MKRFAIVPATVAMLLAATAAHAIPDHLQCYKIKDDASKIAYTATLTPTDGTLGATPGCTVKVPAKLLCVDTTKSAVVPAPPGAPDGSPAQTYLCYKVKCPILKPTWSGEDQFGTHNVTVLKTDLLCAPVSAPVTTTTLPEAECVTAADCPGMDTECQQRTCIGNVCGIENTPPGQPVATQTSGDCTLLVCDGMGSVVPTVDDTDGPNDGQDCTSDSCVNGTPVFTAEPAGTPCSQLGGVVCDGMGSCVECASAADCPGTDTECQFRTCTNNSCGLEFVPAGTPLATQTAGDCRELQCDGAGNFDSVDANTDLPPDDGNQCTDDTCVMGTPSYPAKPDGTPCMQNGGTQCVSGVCQ